VNSFLGFSRINGVCDQFTVGYEPEDHSDDFEMISINTFPPKFNDNVCPPNR
jgi:hypothetical protein